jgi:hypothetical protein
MAYFSAHIAEDKTLVSQASLARLGQTKTLNAGKFIRDEVDARLLVVRLAVCPISR